MAYLTVNGARSTYERWGIGGWGLAMLGTLVERQKAGAAQLSKLETLN